MRLTAPVLLTLGIAACAGGDAPNAITFSESDSAGVHIVVNVADTAALRTGWSVSETPALSIGGASAPEAQQLFQASGALRLPDGRIVVSNAGSGEIRVYSPAGELLATHGRKGEGPGEFTNPTLAGRFAGDSLVVFDPSPRRASILTPDGGYHRFYNVGTEGGGFPIAQGIMPDGGLVIGGGMYFSSDQGFPTGLVRPGSRYLIMAPDGTIRGDLGEMPAAELYATRSGNAFSARAVPFARVTGYAPAATRVWIGTGDGWEVRAYTPEGALSLIVRFDRVLLPQTSALRDAFVEQQVEDAEDENEARSLRAAFAEVPAAETIPPYELFRADALGNLWIGEYLLPGETQRTWTIIGSDGKAIGRLTTPPRTLPLEIGPDYLLGLTRDELDVETLTLWPLTRPM
jgi:hypothetical protein